MSFETGSLYEYSNFGMGLLGNIFIQNAGRGDYEALLLVQIYRPLGMDNTRVELIADSFLAWSHRILPGSLRHLFEIILLWLAQA